MSSSEITPASKLEDMTTNRTPTMMRNKVTAPSDITPAAGSEDMSTNTTSTLTRSRCAEITPATGSEDMTTKTMSTMMRNSSMEPLDIEGGDPLPHPRRRPLTKTEEEWKLKKTNMKPKEVNFGFMVCSRRKARWTAFLSLLAILAVGIAIILSKTLHKHRGASPPPDTYALALRKALLFFDAQMSGKLPDNKRISWRSSSGLKDGLLETKAGLVGGFYDAGNNMKLNFPLAFSMSMLSWSVLEYAHKYKAVGEYNHIREIIKWGADYLLLTFDSSASSISHIYSEVTNLNTSVPEDLYCWQRPEDMEYPRSAVATFSGPDLAGEMVAALAASSMVFQDDVRYSQKLLKGATVLLDFAKDPKRRISDDKGIIAQFYNSTGYYDEYMWATTWMYYATGDSTYLSLATSPSLPENSKAFSRAADLRVLGWDNKLPAAELLLTRIRIFLGPGYPVEEMLRKYHDITERNMCSYLRRFEVFNYTRGGLIELNHGRPRPLQYVVNAAYISSLFVDYLNATEAAGWYCGGSFISSDTLRHFATSQMDYILGANPMNMSYLVGYGTKFPTHVHHRAASIPRDGTKYSCTGGWKWRDSPTPNPYNITGAMVAGPDHNDDFHDVRTESDYTEPTLVGNAGLVAALVSLTNSEGTGIDTNTLFTNVRPMYTSPPAPAPWEP